MQDHGLISELKFKFLQTLFFNNQFRNPDFLKLCIFCIQFSLAFILPKNQVILKIFEYIFVCMLKLDMKVKAIVIAESLSLMRLTHYLQMALVEEQGAGAAADDPEALLNEWLGELTVLTAVSTSNTLVPHLFRHNTTPRSTPGDTASLLLFEKRHVS